MPSLQSVVQTNSSAEEPGCYRFLDKDYVTESEKGVEGEREGWHFLSSYTTNNGLYILGNSGWGQGHHPAIQPDFYYLDKYCARWMRFLHQRSVFHFKWKVVT